MEELDLREKICRAFTTDITVAGGAREAVIGNFFLALILIFSTDSGLVVLIVIILFTFSPPCTPTVLLSVLQRKTQNFLKYLEVI